jgi:sugar lactone lactonase YvrE
MMRRTGWRLRSRSEVRMALMVLVLAAGCAGLPTQGRQQTAPGHGPAKVVRKGVCSGSPVQKVIPLRRPRALAVDAGCNLYIADTANSRVVKVDSRGAASVVAGGGSAAFRSGMSATQTNLAPPLSVAVDSAGNLFVGTEDSRVLEVPPDGTIRAVAGNGSCATVGPPSGLSAQAGICVPNGVVVDREGNLYIADGGNRYVTKVSPRGTISTVGGIGERESSGDGGLSTLARIGDPQGITVDQAGALYLSDGYSMTIRRISGGVITRSAGGGVDNAPSAGRALTAQLYPQGLALDPSGSLYVADDLHHQIQKVTLDGGIHKVAGVGTAGWTGDDGPATAAKLSLPKGVGLDPEGNLYIADTGNDHVRRISRDGIISTVL